MNQALAELLSMPIDVRVDAIDALQESVAREVDSVTLTAEQMAEVERRHEEHLRDPSSARPWREVMKELEDECA